MVNLRSVLIYPRDPVCNTWHHIFYPQYDPLTSEQTLDNSGNKCDEYYDKVYFDSSGSSDEGEMEAVSNGRVNASRVKSAGNKVRKLTNDELFYDPDVDAEDEKWVNRQRLAYHNGTYVELNFPFF